MFSLFRKFFRPRSISKPEPNHTSQNLVSEPDSELDEPPAWGSGYSSSSVRYSGIDFKPDPDSGYGTEYDHGNDNSDNFSDGESGDWSGTAQGGIGW